MTRLLALTVSGLLLASPLAHAQSAAPSRLAVFSPERAFASSPEWKRAEATLRALQTERNKEIEARQRQLQTMQATLARSAAAITESARRLRQQEISKFQVDLKRYVEDAQREFAGVRQDAETAFLAKLEPLVDRVARSRALLLVFNGDSGIVAWVDLSLDITPDVIALLNQP